MPVICNSNCRVNFRSSNNKLAYSYLLTATGIAEKASLTARFLKRKVVEYEALSLEIERLRHELEHSGGVAGASSSSPVVRRRLS